jgi:hypothetical protein
MHLSIAMTRSPTVDTPKAGPQAATLSWLGMMIPFAVIIIAALILGGSRSQIAMTSILLAIPLAILALRWRAGRTVSPAAEARR